jgi:ATP-dependent Clp protease protease subunit
MAFFYDIIKNICCKAIYNGPNPRDRDYWLRSDEAKEYGMIDEVLVRNAKRT